IDVAADVAGDGSGAPVAAVPRARVPARLLTLVALAAVAGTFAVSLVGAARFAADPFADDLRLLRSRSLPQSAAGAWSRRLDAAFGRVRSGGFYVGVERAEEAPAVIAAIAEVERDIPPERRLFGAID